MSGYEIALTSAGAKVHAYKEFGRKYLDEILSVNEILTIVKEAIDWDETAEEMVAFIKEEEER